MVNTNNQITARGEGGPEVGAIVDRPTADEVNPTVSEEAKTHQKFPSLHRHMH